VTIKGIGDPRGLVGTWGEGGGGGVRRGGVMGKVLHRDTIKHWPC